MSQSQPQQPNSIIVFARLAWARFRAFVHTTLAPLARLLWHSSADFLTPTATPENARSIGKNLHSWPMRIERRVESLLPASFKHEIPLKTALLAVVLLILGSMLSSDTSLQSLQESGELVVITRGSPTTLYQGPDGPGGPEYDYLKSFAEFLGVELRLVFLERNSEILEAIANGEGHIAAAGMTSYTPLVDAGVVFAPGYQDVDILVVCRRNHGKQPRDLADLGDIELVVVADSSNEARLFELQQDYPDLSWESNDEATVDDLLQLVWQKEIGCTIANSNEIDIKQRFYPELQIAFTLEETQPLAWTLSPEWTVLSDSIGEWLQAIESNGTLMILRDQHFNNAEFDYVDMRKFIRRIQSRLPTLEPMFQRAAAEYDIPWTLLAAQAYQESHWNRRAKSPTGVRGIMMLTLTTAQEMGVKSRLDAEQSIMGGARYLSQLQERVDDGVIGQDRWWQALAAYNVGMGHLNDARILARQLDLDPDNWLELRGVLPLLSQKKYYQDLKHGRARGNEPVIYVKRVRHYQRVLQAQLARQQGIHAD